MPLDDKCYPIVPHTFEDDGDSRRNKKCAGCGKKFKDQTDYVSMLSCGNPACAPAGWKASLHRESMSRKDRGKDLEKQFEGSTPKPPRGKQKKRKEYKHTDWYYKKRKRKTERAKKNKLKEEKRCLFCREKFKFGLVKSPDFCTIQCKDDYDKASKRLCDRCHKPYTVVSKNKRRRFCCKRCNLDYVRDLNMKRRRKEGGPERKKR